MRQPAAAPVLSNAFQPSEQESPLDVSTDQRLGSVRLVIDQPMSPISGPADQPLGSVRMVINEPMSPITSVPGRFVFFVHEFQPVTPDATSTDSGAAAQGGSSAEEQVQTAVQKPLWAARQQWRSLLAQARATRLAAMRASR